MRGVTCMAPMMTDIDASPWQLLPEFSGDLGNKLAAISSTFDLLAVWNFHGAQPSLRASAHERAARVKTGIKSAHYARSIKKMIRDNAKGGRA